MLFADDRGLIVNNPSHSILENDINMIFFLNYEWFNTNLLSLNKEHCTQFST
jgi:hypothetical protein